MASLLSRMRAFSSSAKKAPRSRAEDADADAERGTARVRFADEVGGDSPAVTRFAAATTAAAGSYHRYNLDDSDEESELAATLDEDASPYSQAYAVGNPVARRSARTKGGTFTSSAKAGPSSPYSGLGVGVTPHREVALERIGVNRVRGAALRSMEVTGAAPSPLVSASGSRASIESGPEEGDAGSPLLSETHHDALSANSYEVRRRGQRHPCYGELLADLGFKQVYQALARELCSGMSIWQKQRPIDEHRVEEIVAAKRNEPSFPGVLSIFDFVEISAPNAWVEQKCAIFDGQHRYRAIMTLLEQVPQERDFPLIVEVFPVYKEQDVLDLFHEINSSESVQTIDLPSHLSPPFKRMIDAVCARLEREFPKMFGNERCQPPNTYLPKLRNDLFHSVVLRNSEHANSADAIYDLVMRCNEDLKALKKASWPRGRRRNLPKAQRNGFFLGLKEDWIPSLLEDYAAYESADEAEADSE